MGFIRKIWQDRVSTFPNRRKLKNTETNEETIVLVERYEGDVNNSGTELSASSFNDLETRIENAFLAEELRVTDEILPAIEKNASGISDLSIDISKGDASTLTKANAYTDNLASGAVKVNTDAIVKINDTITEIKNSDTGILAQSKTYTDEKIGDVDLSGIEANSTAIEAINNEETGILTQANNYTDEQISNVVIERSPTTIITSIKQPTDLKNGDVWEEVLNEVEFS